MEHACRIVAAGHWPRQAQRDLVRLTYEERFRRRWRFIASGGLEFLLDLPDARLLHHGDGLALDGGGFVAVEALAEPLIEVTMPDAHALARIAWHLGNRHVPVQLGDRALRLRDDHVLADLLLGLGASLRAIEAPFTPEGGGYSLPQPREGHHHRAPQAESETPARAALYRLMTWLSPAYPVGGFSYSHGLEYAVEVGLVRDCGELVAWITSILCDGAGRLDGALFAAAWRAARSGDGARLDDLAALAAAWRGTAELALESAAQGTAFVTITLAASPDAQLAALAGRHGGKLAFPVAVGVALAAYVPLGDGLAGYLTAFAANLVSAGVRLIPLGQTDGQCAIAALEPVVARAGAAALTADLEELGSAAPMLDWVSMRHETQYTRLFRS